MKILNILSMNKNNQILFELKNHSPFTALGAVSGIIILIISLNVPKNIAYNIFYILHPLHVFLSALVTAAILNLHSCKNFNAGCLKGRCNFWKLLMVGYIGSVGIATVSDCVIPFLCEIMLNMPHSHIHLGFIEKWWLVNPLAIAGILLAYFHPSTKFPHAGHVLLSTWASTFHIIMAIGVSLSIFTFLIILLFLFIAVWIPCCVSDIIFPMLFAGHSHKKY